MNGVENRIIQRLVEDRTGRSTFGERIIAILQIYDTVFTRINRCPDNTSTKAKKLSAVMCSISRSLAEMTAQLDSRRTANINLNNDNIDTGNLETKKKKNRRRRVARNSARITWRSPYLSSAEGA